MPFSHILVITYIYFQNRRRILSSSFAFNVNINIIVILLLNMVLDKNLLLQKPCAD